MKKRLLPKWVSSYKDRHGKQRLRFRKTGSKPYTFRADFGTEEFRVEYRACLDGESAPPIRAGQDRARPGTVADLVARYYRSSSFNSGSEVTRRKNKGILDAFREQCKDDYVADFEWHHVDAILSKKAEKHPAAAKNLRKQLKRLFRYAVKAKMITSSPAELTEPIKSDSKGHYSWKENDIAAFRAKWKLGTTPRLALEIMLWTGMRRFDAILFGPGHIIDGEIHYTQTKTGKELVLPLAEQLAEAIEATKTGAKTFLINQYGRPYTQAGIGNQMRRWCDEAGLPECTAHGLRKAIARRMAELGAANQRIKAVGGWSGDAEVALYTKAAEQKKMAADAIRDLSDWEKLANREEKLAKDSCKSAENLVENEARGGPGGTVESSPNQSHATPNLSRKGNGNARRTEPNG